MISMQNCVSLMLLKRCDKSCDVGEYLDYENCKCRKKLIDKLVEVCSENIYGNEVIYNETVNDYEKFVILLQYT